MGTITRSVQQVKDDLHGIINPQTIIDLCRQLGHEWRDTKLNPVTTICLFIRQILHGNTSCTHVRQFANFAFHASAYCEARQRLPVVLLLKLLQSVARQVSAQAEDYWLGHRVLGIDGSSFSMSDTAPLRGLFRYAPQQKAGCGFPTARFVAIFQLGSGALVDIVSATMREAELPLARVLQRCLRRGDLLVGDRAYCSYGHICTLLQRHVHAVFRMHGSMKVSFQLHRRLPRSRWIQRLGLHDQIVEWTKPRQCPTWLTKRQYRHLPDRIQVRELRYRVSEPGFRSEEVTIATTLLDSEQYPREAIAELYLDRWQVETNLRHLKTTMRMDVLRCQTVDGIHRELAVFGIVYNAVCSVRIHAAQAQRVTPDRISFIDVLRWLAGGCQGTDLPQFVVNHKRDRPSQPRVVKRRHKDYTYMTLPNRPRRKPRQLREMRLI